MTGRRTMVISGVAVLALFGIAGGLGALAWRVLWQTEYGTTTTFSEVDEGLAAIDALPVEWSQICWRSSVSPFGHRVYLSGTFERAQPDEAFLANVEGGMETVVATDGSSFEFLRSGRVEEHERPYIGGIVSPGGALKHDVVARSGDLVIGLLLSGQQRQIDFRMNATTGVFWGVVLPAEL